MDNDDFLSDLDNAVEGVDTVETSQQIAENLDNDVKPEKDQSSDSLEDELLKLTDGDPEPQPKKRKTLSVKPDGKEQKDEQAKPETVEKDQPEKTEKQKRLKLFMDSYLLEDDKSNFITSDGSIIATSGTSRKFFEGLKREARDHRDKAERLAMDNADLGRQLRDSKAAYDAVKESDTIKPLTERTGMNENELQEAIGFLKAYKADPLDGIKKILTSARANGIDISSLGVHGGNDLSVIRDMIRNEVRPHGESPAQREPTPEEYQQQVKDEFTNLVSNDTDAQEILLGADEENQRLQQIFLDGVRRNPTVSITRLWYAFKQELRKAEEARNSQPQPQPQPQQPLQPRNERPPEQTSQQPRRQAAQRNYGNMSYEELARSIKEDFK